MKFTILLCVVLFLGVCQGGSLTKNFYRNSCPQAEDIIKSQTQQHVSANPNLPAKLIRLHFHDCFVRVYTYILLSIPLFYVFMFSFKGYFHPVFDTQILHVTTCKSANCVYIA